jgi:hypothetical protein
MNDDDNRVLVRLLRDQPRACECCGKFFKIGDEVFMPREDAERFVQTGDAVFVFVTDEPR